MTDCGIAVIVAKDGSNVAPLLYKMGIKLQHRGELSTGMVLYNQEEKEKLHVHKGAGLVSVVFQDVLSGLKGTRGAIHVRYATSGACGKNLNDLIYQQKVEEEAQPFYRRHGNRRKRFAIVWNGNLTNTESLKSYLEQEKQYDLATDTDTEILLHTIAIASHQKELLDVFKQTTSRIQGAYCIAYLNGLGEVVALRDTLGFRPLCYGETDKLFAVASETLALQSIGISDFSFVKPGQMLTYTDRAIQYQLPSAGNAECVFERVYFSHVASWMEEGSIYETRRKLGRHMALLEPLHNRNDLIVIPIPDTAKTAAKAYADELGWEFVQEGIIKSIGRGFIEPPRTRSQKMDIKYDLVTAALTGRNIVLIDDSIVRGDTLSRLLWKLYHVGVKEAHVRSTFPPVKHPCFYGIDFPTSGELIANQLQHTTQEELEKKMAEKLYNDVKYQAKKDIDFTITVKYLTIEALLSAIGLPENHTCRACLDGKYPLSVEHPNFRKHDKEDN